MFQHKGAEGITETAYVKMPITMLGTQPECVLPFPIYYVQKPDR